MKGNDKNNSTGSTKPNSMQNLALELALAVMVQWKSLVQCFTSCNSPIELVERVGTLIFVTLGIAKPGALVYHVLTRMVNVAFEKVLGYPLTPKMSADMERWFQVVISFIAQYGFAALWSWSKNSVTCLQNNDCEGVLLLHYMGLRSLTCGLLDKSSVPTCHYVLNRIPLAIVITTCVIIFIFSIIHIIDESRRGDLPAEILVNAKAPTPTAPKDRMVDSVCPNCEKQARIPVPPSLRVIYCKSC